MATARATTRSRGRKPPPTAEELKLSPEVHWYLVDRGIPLPDCPPTIKTPEPRKVKGAVFDPDRVDRVLRAFHLLRHTQGQWAGRPLDPDPWQVAYIIAPVFGWVRWDRDAGPTGSYVRIIQNLYVDIPRKNGKTTLVGGIGLYLTCADGERGAQVVSAASSERQAGYLFNPIKHLAQKAPALRKHVIPLQKRIVHTASNSYLEVVASVADALHGGNIHGGLVDELHVHKNPELVETIETGTGSRTQPLIAIITTADDGKQGTIYDRKRDYVEKLAKRVFTDESTYGVVWCADKEDDPFAEATWRKANPGYGISPTKAYLKKAATKAKNSPAELSSFLRLHLGIRTKQTTAYIQISDWDASAGLVDEQALEGRECRGGLDLAAVEDITALAWTFPDDDGGFSTVWRFWLPEEKRDLLAKRTAKASQVWEREGWLTFTPGNVIDHDFIVARILADASKFKVLTIGYDRWSANEIVHRLTDEGIECVGVGQGFQSMSQPLKEVLRLVKAGKYRHGGNPVMRWMVDNLAVKMDPAGNVKPDKATSGDKIDGVSAAVTAMREILDAAEAEDLPDADIF